MSESRFYHIPKSGRLNRCERVADAMELVEKEGGFFWLHYLEPTSDDLHPLIQQLDLHPLAVEDALDDNQLPKIDDFPSSTFIVPFRNVMLVGWM